MQTSGRQAFDGRGESADQVTTSIYRAVLAEQADWTIDLVPKTLGGARDYLADVRTAACVSHGVVKHWAQAPRQGWSRRARESAGAQLAVQTGSPGAGSSANAESLT